MSEHNKINMEELTASGDERFRWIGNTVLSYLKRIESLEKDNEYINSVEERLTRVETWIKGEPSLKGLEKRIDEIRNSITIHRVGDKLSHMKNIQVEFGKRIDTHWEVNQETMKRVSEVEKLKESVDLFAPPVIDEFRKRFDALEKKLDNAQYEYWNITRPVFMMHCQEFFERVSALEVFRLNMVDDNKVLIDNDLDASKRMVLLEASCASHTHEKKRHLTTTSKASPPPNTPVLEGSDDTKSNEKFSGDLVDGKGGSGNPIRDAVFNVLKDGEPRCKKCGRVAGALFWGCCVDCHVPKKREPRGEPVEDPGMIEGDFLVLSTGPLMMANKQEVLEVIKENASLRDKVTGLNNLVDVGIREQESLRKQLAAKELERESQYKVAQGEKKALQDELAAKEKLITNSFRRVDVDAMKDDLKGKIEQLEKIIEDLGYPLAIPHLQSGESIPEGFMRILKERDEYMDLTQLLVDSTDATRTILEFKEKAQMWINMAGNVSVRDTNEGIETVIDRDVYYEKVTKAAKWDKTVMVGMENEGYEIRIYNPEGMKIVNKILDKEKALDDIIKACKRLKDITDDYVYENLGNDVERIIDATGYAVPKEEKEDAD